MKITDTSANRVADLQSNQTQANEQTKTSASVRGEFNSVNLNQAQEGSARNTQSMRRVPPGSENLMAARSGIDLVRSTGAFGVFKATGAWTRAASASAMPDGLPDKSYDGTFIGSGGKAYSSNTPLSEIPSIKPNNGAAASNETIIYVNGIRNQKSDQANSMQDIANKTGANVIGIHNSTESTFKDLVQSLGDKLDLGNNPAVDSVANAVYSELKAGHDVHLMGHSQGGLILSRALSDVKKRLMLEDGMSKNQAEGLMSKVKVETFGAAAGSYPDGPKYVHYINRADPVPMLFGLGSFKGLFGDKGAGKGAQVVRFTQFSNVHDFSGTYLSRRQPF